MLHRGLVIFLLWNSFLCGFSVANGIHYSNLMRAMCDGIANRIFCECDPSDTEIKQASCTLIYDPLPDDEVWIHIGSNPDLSELRIYSRPEGRLTSWPTSAFNPDVLAYLNIAYANISTVPAFAFRNSSTITSVTLSNNNIVFLEPYAFAYLQSLSELYLSENHIKIVKKNTFVQLTNLKVLMLDGNLIEVLEDGTFIGLSRLQELSLKNNAIQDLKPGLFKGLASLDNLELGKNKIRHLRPGSFSGLTKVRVIDLRENEISSIDSQTFEGLPNLMTLYLIRNQLSNLRQDTFRPLPSLEYLDLRQNKLKTLTEMTIKSMNLNNTSRVYLLVAENQFVCDCRLRWMLQLATVRNLTAWTEVKCVPPDEGGPIEFGTKKHLNEDFEEEGDFHIQASEKHLNLAGETLLSDAKAYMENCPDVQEEEDLDKRPAKTFILDKALTLDKDPKMAPGESVSLGLTKTSTAAPDIAVTDSQTTQTLPHNSASNLKSRGLMMVAYVICCFLLIFAS